MVVPGRFTKLTPKNKKKFLQRTFNEKNEFTELINFFLTIMFVQYIIHFIAAAGFEYVDNILLYFS